MDHAVPQRLPVDLELPEGSGETLRTLAWVWLRATPDSIGRDLEMARLLVAAAPPRESELAERYLAALRRLECWLRDH